MKRHAATVCEICREALRPHHETLEVGRKANGVPRLIHNRHHCRKRWEREGHAIMAEWPENRDRDVQGKLPLMKEPFTAARRMEMETANMARPQPAAAPEPESPPKAVQEGVKNVEYAIARRGKLKATDPRMIEWVIQKLKPFYTPGMMKRGTILRLYHELRGAHPEWLNVGTPLEYGHDAFGNVVRAQWVALGDLARIESDRATGSIAGTSREEFAGHVVELDRRRAELEEQVKKLMMVKAGLSAVGELHIHINRLLTAHRWNEIAVIAALAQEEAAKVKI